MLTLHIISPLFIGTTELLLIVAVTMLLFGSKKLPELMHGFGKGISDIKKEFDIEDVSDIEDSPKKKKKDSDIKEDTNVKQ